MGQIRVEYLPVQIFGLGAFGFDHLQLTYEDETDLLGQQDYWYVLEGVVEGNPLFGGTLGVIGTDGTTFLSSANLANRQELVDKIGTPEARGSRVVVSSPSASTQWNTMADYGAEIDEQAFPYIAGAWPFSPTPTINSNSVIASLLWSIGIDVNEVMPHGIRRAPGTSTLIGTTKDDELRTTSSFTQILGGEGKDTLHGIVNLIWVEKLYGGTGDDWFMWSKGENIINGGQPQMRYAGDGLDTIDYSGVGEVHIIATKHAVEHKSPTYISDFAGGSDQMFSIEQVAWDRKNDIVKLGQGVELLEKPLMLDMKDNSGGRGDIFGMGEGDAPLIIVAVDDELTAVQTAANQGLDAGYWVRSAEWIEGSRGNDKIYAGAATLGVDGGAGDDIVDGRLSAAFSGESPLGYDIELYGGDGNDFLVSGEGRTYASGGFGDDSFVLSSMTSGAAGTVEFIIDGADAGDKIYVPYDYFKLARGGYDGSVLFQLTGAPFKIDDVINPSYFEWGLPSDDQIHGNIEFTGLISYAMDGADLVISLYLGHAEEFTVDYGPGEPPGPTLLLNVGEEETLTKIRITNWSEGAGGISFPLTWDNGMFSDAGSFDNYPGYADALNAVTNGDRFIAPLDPRPDAHVPLEFEPEVTVAARLFSAASSSAAGGYGTEGTPGDDVLAMAAGGPYHFKGYGGRDDITGTRGGDIIDGGAGNDDMRGGAGNDTYYVDNVLDRVIEDDRGGFDTVISSINYTLGDFVEHVALTGSALNATGNALRNTMEGNALDNTLIGNGGDDTFAGNGGDDTLIGGDGSDGYVYEMGDGHDTIIDTPQSGDGNVIVLASGITAADISFERRPAAFGDLVLAFSDGGSITVKDYFTAAAPIISGVTFASGPAWSAADVSARAAAALVSASAAPVAADDAFAYARSSRFGLASTYFLGNDTDPDGDALTIIGVSNVSGGQVTLASGGILSFTPGSGNLIAFDYTVADPSGRSDTARAEIALIANSAPIISSSTLSAVREDQPAAGNLSAFDADGDALSYAVKAGAGPAKGRVALSQDGTFSYTPNANANGSEAFTITVTDGKSAAVEQRFAFTIAAVNDAPVAKADAGLAVLSGATLTLKPRMLLANDSDIDGDALTVLSVGGGTRGTVSLAANGDIQFKAGAAGAGGFTYTVSDGKGGTATATASVTIKPAATSRDIIGTEKRDTLTGTNAGDVFIGKGGDDVLRGGGGDDVFKIFGDAGLDQIDGGAGFDMILGSGGNDVVRVNSHMSNLKNLEKIDGGAGFDRITGTSGNDTLDFSKLKLQGIETIDLGAGNDIVKGSAGRDVFAGGAGNDTFVFRPGGGHDTILDFTPGSYFSRGGDMLDLRGNGIKGVFDLFRRMDQVGHDTVIKLDATTEIRLKDISKWSLIGDKFFIL
jgi:VCBS repeat-containing protein